MALGRKDPRNEDPSAFQGKVRAGLWEDGDEGIEKPSVKPDQPSRGGRRNETPPPTPAIPRGVTGKGPLGNVNAHVWVPI